MTEKKKYKPHLIKEVIEYSIADELEIEAGDTLLAINGQSIEDVFDYRYLVSDEEYLEILIEKSNKEMILFEIEKDIDEDLGFVFKNDLMDDLIKCRNQCKFCFIDQLPPHMRQTVYFKDDDWRMSFLHGNYITLTNMSKADMDRLIFYKLSPVNISIHATDPDVRISMLNNRFAGNIIDQIKYLTDAGIKVNGQIVLCRGLNDADVLDKTIQDLSQFIPNILSLTIVPVGLSKYRDGLTNLKPFRKKDALEVIKTVEKWQKFYLEKMNTRFVFIADEFYVTANYKLPAYTEYEDFPVLENGVGMLTRFEHEFDNELKNFQPTNETRTVSIATGTIATDFIEKQVYKLKEKAPNINVNIYPIVNHFFGELISVTGLLTGQDIIKQLKNKDLGDTLLLSETMLKNDSTILLDDMTIQDISTGLDIPITIVENDGAEFIKSILETKEYYNE